MAHAGNIVPLQPGEVLGGYQLLVTVGAGGMGKVWAARRVDAKGPGVVALKTTLEEMAGNEQFGCMLLDEARIAASIVHPNVCSIREVGAERGIQYLVMDWMDAGTLLDLLSASPNRRIDFFLAVRIISGVAAGLHAAHELTGPDGSPLHVVHRDVSPQNVLLSSAGHVKVADFGVAKARGQLHAPTETGEVKGKLSYMAPEQLTTKLFDRRADVFALGCCLFEATTGERPFHGDDALETMYKLLETDCVRPSTLVAEFPTELETILMRALEKDPAKRFQTADDLRVALEGFLARCGRLVTDRDVAALIRSTLGQTLDTKAKVLREAAKTLSDKTAPHRLATGFEITESNKGQIDSTRHAWNTIPPDRKRPKRERLALLGVALVAVLGTVVWSKVKSPGAVEETRTSANILPATGAAQLVTVTLRADPPGASLRIDDGPLLPSPQVLQLVPSQVLHLVHSSLEGYEPMTRQAVFDRTQELVLGLVPRAPEPPPIASTSSRKTPRPGPAATVRDAPPQDTSASADPLAPKRKRPKRQIDPSNPYSDP